MTFETCIACGAGPQFYGGPDLQRAGFWRTRGPWPPKSCSLQISPSPVKGPAPQAKTCVHLLDWVVYIYLGNFCWAIFVGCLYILGQFLLFIYIWAIFEKLCLCKAKLTWYSASNLSQVSKLWLISAKYCICYAWKWAIVAYTDL